MFLAETTPYARQSPVSPKRLRNAGHVRNHVSRTYGKSGQVTNVADTDACDTPPQKFAQRDGLTNDTALSSRRVKDSFAGSLRLRSIAFKCRIHDGRFSILPHEMRRLSIQSGDLEDQSGTSRSPNRQFDTTRVRRTASLQIPPIEPQGSPVRSRTEAAPPSGGVGWCSVLAGPLAGLEGCGLSWRSFFLRH